MRLKYYDYSQEGCYFITICTKNKQMLFGNIIDGEMRLNEYGRIAKNEIIKTKEIRKNVIIPHFIVMPNHIHFIVELAEDVGTYRIHQKSPSEWDRITHMENSGVCNTPLQSPSQTVGAIVRGYKGAVSRQIGFPVWQGNYRDHIIRREKSYLKIAEYIDNNPLKWELDCHNPTHPKYNDWIVE